ncbi:MAG: DUF4157 domain-containing protein [Anaerolineales bacterium]|nr:DUF4157 domain-containing protein [Anaerolineales bacterium]
MSPEPLSEERQQKQRPPERAEPLQPQAEPASPLSGLQRMVGNRAVQRLVQAKLTVGPVNDAYEQEADRVAEQVMNAPAQPAAQRMGEEEEAVQSKPLAAGISRLAQRSAAEEDELQSKRLQRSGAEEDELQSKALQRSGAEEDELQSKALQRSGAEEDELQSKALQRLGAEEDELQSKALVQRRGDGSFDAGAAVEERLAARAGAGSPLPEATRGVMEERFGADFSGVRVHTDSEAGQISQDLSAQAFTHGGDVYFNAGKYDPGSADGQRLLAHELTHVVQQGAAKPAQRHAQPADEAGDA